MTNLPPASTYRSETSTVRHLLAPYCIGTVLDLGHGGLRPIVDHAICMDRPVGHPERVPIAPEWTTHIEGDVTRLREWFRDGSIDTIYSSHTLEDFKDTTAVLREWLAVLRTNGRLILFLPDQAAYAAHCAAHNQLPNQAHKHANFSLAFLRPRIWKTGFTTRELLAKWPCPPNPYSFAVVLEKL